MAKLLATGAGIEISAGRANCRREIRVVPVISSPADINLDNLVNASMFRPDTVDKWRERFRYYESGIRHMGTAWECRQCLVEGRAISIYPTLFAAGDTLQRESLPQDTVELALMVVLCDTTTNV